MKTIDFFKTHEYQEREWLWKGNIIKKLDRTRVQTEDEEFDFNDNIQKVFLNTTKGPLIETKNDDKVKLLGLLENVVYCNQTPIQGHISGRDKYIRGNFGDEE